MKPPPEMLEVPDNLRPIYRLGQMMVNMQPAASVYSGSDVTDHVEGLRKDSLDFVPKHGRGFEFEL